MSLEDSTQLGRRSRAAIALEDAVHRGLVPRGRVLLAAVMGDRVARELVPGWHVVDPAAEPAIDRAAWVRMAYHALDWTLGATLPNLRAKSPALAPTLRCLRAVRRVILAPGEPSRAWARELAEEIWLVPEYVRGDSGEHRLVRVAWHALLAAATPDPLARQVLEPSERDLLARIAPDETPLDCRSQALATVGRARRAAERLGVVDSQRELRRGIRRRLAPWLLGQADPVSFPASDSRRPHVRLAQVEARYLRQPMPELAERLIRECEAIHWRLDGRGILSWRDLFWGTDNQAAWARERLALFGLKAAPLLVEALESGSEVMEARALEVLDLIPSDHQLHDAVGQALERTLRYSALESSAAA